MNHICAMSWLLCLLNMNMCFTDCKNLIMLSSGGINRLFASLKFCFVCWSTEKKLYESQHGKMMCFSMDIEYHSITFTLLCNVSPWESMALLYRAAQCPCSAV